MFISSTILEIWSFKFYLVLVFFHLWQSLSFPLSKHWLFWPGFLMTFPIQSALSLPCIPFSLPPFSGFLPAAATFLSLLRILFSYSVFSPHPQWPVAASSCMSCSFWQPDSTKAVISSPLSRVKSWVTCLALTCANSNNSGSFLPALL